MQFAGTNKEGYVVFPEYFRPGEVNKSGVEMDGHGAIIIAMAGLWQRLPATHAFRPGFTSFCTGKARRCAICTTCWSASR